MTTGVPFFDVYLQSLINPEPRQTTIDNTTATQPFLPSGRRLGPYISNILRSPHQSATTESTSTFAATNSKTDHNAKLRCFRLSPELWCTILHQLPLSQVPELSLVCRHLFCIIRFKCGFWFQVQKIVSPIVSDPMPLLGGPTPLEILSTIEWLAYAKLRFDFGSICDTCYKGKGLNEFKHGSAAVHPVQSPYTTATTTSSDPRIRKLQRIYLCLPCRQRHYLTFPEPIPAHINNNQQHTLPYDDATQKYCLPRTTHTKRARILEIDAIRIGRQVNGGDAGIRSEQRRIASGGARSVKLPRNIS